MSCEEMQMEWEEIEEEIEELIPSLPEAPPMAVILEEVHEESHILIDFEKRVLGKPNLKKSEMSVLLLRAGQIVIERLLEKNKLDTKHLQVKGMFNSS